MTERQDQNEEKVIPLDGPAGDTGLPYTVELWDLRRVRPDRVLGRAASVVLARAIFDAARTEHLGRRIVLRRGSRLIAETD